MDSLQPGQMLGPYRIISQIGQGGMAAVYKAYHAAMDRYVALKILPRQLAENPHFTGRFQQEARIIANLEHPQILPVHDYGESEGIAYLVMRYLDSGTLKDRLRERPPSLPEVDLYFGQLAEALEYAHAHGVVHRDLKPSNVLVDERGHVFLTDFGIAKLLEGSSQFTGTGALIGTPDYMSPEQAQGFKVDQRTDIYSLGIILYEMVTGRVPFEAETPLAVILQHVNAPLPLPTSLRPGLSPAIERVLLKALAKSPGDRFPSVDAFHQAWKQALTEANIAPLSPAEPALSLQAAPSRTAAGAPTVAAPAPSSPAAITGVAQPAARTGTARRGLPLAPIILGAGLLVILCGGLVILVLAQAVPRLVGFATTAPAVTLPAAASPTAVVVAAASPAPTPQPGWTSWAGMNHAWALAVSDDKIVAGGRGLAIWDRHSGNLLQRFISPADGLPNVLIRSILIGDGGSVWVATDDGVGFYDGQKWTTYGAADGLDSTTVSALARTNDGLLAGTQYCGTDGCGLNLFMKDGVKPVTGFPSVAQETPGTLSPSVTALLVDQARKVWWVGTTRGLGRFDETENKWTAFFQADGLPNETISALMVDSAGTLWVGTGRGAARFDGQRFESLDRLADTSVQGIVQDAQGRYWFACDNSLRSYTPPAGNAPAKWEQYTQQDNGLPSLGFYSAVANADGNLYFGSDGGIVRYDGTAFSNWVVPNVPVFGAYSRILPAPDAPGGAALWFVELYGGPSVDRFDLRSQTWSLVTTLPDGCTPLAVDAGRAVWCGGSQGLWILNADGSQTHLTTDQGLPSNEVTAIAFPAGAKGTAWLGTADRGVALFAGQKITQVFNSQSAGLTSNHIQALLAASDGSLWIGTDQGLNHYSANGQWAHYTVGNPFDQGLEGITSVVEAAHGVIWVSTAGEGNVVHQWSAGQWQRLAAGQPGVKLPGSSIQSLTVAPDGSVWFGSASSGAARFDGQTWTTFNIQDGLINPNIHDIYVDQQGTVWFATEGGVSRYRP